MSTTAETERARTTTGVRGLAWLYVVGGAIGLLASFALIIEKIATLRNPDYVPTCSLNPVVSCGSVMDSPQAELFGFPNPLIGIAAFAVMVTAGVVLLVGFAAPRWFWLGLQLGTTLGVVFVHWLIWQSLYDIGALCPYCMVVWVVTIPMFWYTTLFTAGQGHLPTGPARPAALALARFHSLVLVLWFLLIVVLILQRFWTFWTGG
ncbi:Uncharacterized membrane protein [Amycolatopsis arida]|uniref:Uncharacterized membrane protein n=1 Tax=Amycolatopsis arida TaxID=587909 RepID=A0A1I5QD31_9PSEU|nr:vitamin K epoxide reductase family protein [Amycolatopsis arida]TDX98795.1 putative membrane protein [Amycolatopsis arida]SFP44165.1 Uncharacterized membrane protein [Amycolatopsis arida]